MRWIDCKHHDTKVMESRELYDGEVIRRRRECLQCNSRFTTYERVEAPVLIVVKKDGKHEQFLRQKVANGIYRACEKREIPQLKIEQLISKIEKKLRTRGETEITSKEIGDIVLKELAELDDVSYIRFASVYKSFNDIASFQDILNELNKEKTKI